MYGETLYGDTYAKTIIPLSFSDADISFNDYPLKTDNICITYFNPYDSNDSEYNTYAVPRNNGVWFLSKYWRDKPLIIKWYIKTDTASELEAKIDELKKYLRGDQKILQYKLSDGTFRRVKATMTDIKFDRNHYNITWIKFEISLKVNEPFFYDKVMQEQITEGVGTWIFTEEYTNNGSEVSEPQFFLFFDISSVTEFSLWINGRTIVFTGNISWGDVLFIDCLNKKIQLNWIDQDYSWTFPSLEPWVNTANFEATGATTYDISVVFRSNYL